MPARKLEDACVVVAIKQLMQVDVVSMAHSRFLANYKHEVFMLD
jgi:hypothetical protein